ncbi:MAG: phosphate/phosphite/phosphonate ABC transporter substrate-binding protein, partial [Bryobacter sp.]|nr:phosphate/phosphite/phosphonate ABC transporter substrate-binding protein [Bryobacter sp.]
MILLLLVASPLVWPADELPPTQLRIGILAYKEKDGIRKRWLPMAQYLERQIPNLQVTILPLTHAEVEIAAQQQQVELLIVNSPTHIQLARRNGATALATLKGLYAGGMPSTRLGGVVFRKSSRSDLRTLADLRGKRLLASAPEAFGGWIAVWRELRRVGINPQRDLASLEFANGVPEAVVRAVRDGKADAGTLGTGFFEQMMRRGLIQPHEFEVLPPPDLEAFPLVRSTRLYPETPLTRLPHLPDEVARRVAVFLLALGPGDEVSRATLTGGWDLPSNYQSVHDCLQELRLG